MQEPATKWKTWQKWVLGGTGLAVIVTLAGLLFSHPPKNTPVADAVDAINESLFKDSLINAVIKDAAFKVKAVKIVGDSLFVALDHIDKEKANNNAGYFMHHYRLDSSHIITTCLVYTDKDDPFTQAPAGSASNNKKATD